MTSSRRTRHAATATLLATGIGLIGLSAAPAQADDGYRKGTFRKAGNAYTLTLHDARDFRVWDREDREWDDTDALRATIKVNARKPGKRWTVVIKRNGKTVHRFVKRANRYGDLTATKRFRGDDDDRITYVVQHNNGGPIAFKRTWDLDD